MHVLGSRVASTLQTGEIDSGYVLRVKQYEQDMCASNAGILRCVFEKYFEQVHSKISFYTSILGCYSQGRMTNGIPHVHGIPRRRQHHTFT